MTMLEILIVVMLVGVVVPPLTSSLSRQSAQRARNTARDVALIYAEEGVELMLNGGYRHWYSLARPASFPVTPCYSYNAGFTPPAVVANNITLTVAPTSQSNDDPFCPFVGTQGWSTGNLMYFRPWSQFRRTMEIVSHGSLTAVPRYLNGTVRVYYGPDTANDVVTVPLWISNHHPVSQDTDTDNALRGIVWMPSSITLSSINDVPVEPTCSAACQFPRKTWGKAPEDATRWLLDSVYPVASPIGAPSTLGYPP